MRSRKELANALRILAVDAVETSKSGHPGAPMGMADMAEALWRGVLRHNPANPGWVNRDRFILSNGHASMLLYGLLHLTGYDLSMNDIRNFRQFGSRTPGHPEVGHTPGVEMTTGPLGQGLGSAVGMALAEKLLAEEFNRPDLPVVDHYTYVFAGDGCLMEGVSQEAVSLAGALGLGKLIVLYDDNNISIDGKVDDWFKDDTPGRFLASGWHVVRDVDGHDAEALDAAMTLSRATRDKPSLICCRTVIAYGAPNKSNSNTSHGSPLGAEEVTATRIMLGWEEEPFDIPQDVAEAWDGRPKGAEYESAWNDLFARYQSAYPAEAAEFERRMRGELPAAWQQASTDAVQAAASAGKTMASRQASGACLDAIAPALPELFGGSADLTGSVNTLHAHSVAVRKGQWKGNYLHYGVREFEMGCVMNGLALHGGFIPYGGTFLVFSDYMRGAIRLSALMRQKVVYVLTHDSIGVGEDGPTHQPVEHTPSLRLIPGLNVWRPADATETAVAWKSAVETDGPSALVLSRQNLPAQTYTEAQRAAIARGGYVLRDCDGEPEAIVIATGSELHLAVQAAESLSASGRRVRVVSMPCVDVFEQQDQAWRDSVLPPSVRARVAVEAAATDGWYKFVGLDGQVIGMTGFGASAPGGALFTHFGFTAERVADAVKAVMQR